MGVDVQGYTLTDNKDVFEICSTIEDALQGLQKPLWVNWEIHPRSEMAVARFAIDDEKRLLHVFFRRYDDCPGDSKIMWELSLWGSAEEIVMAVCKAMTKYGQTFFVENDIDGEPVEVLPDRIVA